MKSYLAYIRVSTTKQGEHGSSLQEQKSAIEAYAARQHLVISGWFEEVETAAKQGRPMFAKLLGELRKGRADGVIIHKIDRSARNLKDWALIGDLIDGNVDVHFAHESLDLTSRGGRLAADIQAVVASDYIRNLRDEVKKGFYGRLKQGFYPLPAPRGYLDRGRAKAKDINPIEGPLIRQAFELYATGTYSLEMLRIEMHARGLRTKSGAPLSLHGIANILHNPFYVGLIRIWRTGETFEGVHEPLVTKELFERVQAIMSGRVFARPQAHDFAFRRFIRCSGCPRTLTGERQKDHAYYRCHGRQCRGTSLADGEINAFVHKELALLNLDEEDAQDFREIVRSLVEEERAGGAQRGEHVNRDLALLEGRIRRLTDAYLDGEIDKDAHNERRATLLMERRALREGQAKGTSDALFWETVLQKFERGNVAQQGYIDAFGDEKRELLKSIGSNLIANGKSIDFPMDFPFSTICDWRLSTYCEPRHRQVRKSGDSKSKKSQARVSTLIDRIRDQRPTDVEMEMPA